MTVYRARRRRVFAYHVRPYALSFDVIHAYCTRRRRKRGRGLDGRIGVFRPDRITVRGAQSGETDGDCPVGRIETLSEVYARPFRPSFAVAAGLHGVSFGTRPVRRSSVGARKVFLFPRGPTRRTGRARRESRGDAPWRIRKQKRFGPTTHAVSTYTHAKRHDVITRP